MPIRGCFFCGSSRKDLALEVTFQEVRTLGSSVTRCELAPIIKQCETVFGIKASKLSPTGERFELLYATGFHSIYGLSGQSSDGQVQVIRKTDLNDFFIADNVADKKMAYFSACKKYFEWILNEKFKSNPEDLAVLQPIKQYCLQYFTRATFAFLNENRQKGESQADYIQRLKIFARCVEAFILTAIDLEILVNLKIEIKHENLKNILVRWNKVPIVTDTPSADRLGYSSALTMDQAISQTLQLIQEHEEHAYTQHLC